MFFLQWTITLYVTSIPLNIVLRIWDIMLLDTGPIIVFKVPVAFFMYYK